MEPEMAAIVGVHGIAQQQLGRHQLREPWRRSLADGLERASGARVAPPPLDIAYYGDLFLPARDDTKGAPPPSEEDLSPDEVSELVAAVDEIAAEPPAEPQEKGFTRSPAALQAAIRLLDRQFGAAMGAVCVGELRQVLRYLRDPRIRAEVDARVDAASTPACRVLIGHSLGSVVALAHALRHPERRFDLLLTLGSPLGLTFVHSRVAGPGPLRRPPSVRRWVDIRDPHDPVASVPVASRWDGVTEFTVNNQADAHAAERYLGKRPTGEAVLAVLPELGP